MRRNPVSEAAIPRSTSRVASSFTCSRSRCCESRSVERSSSSFLRSAVALSRAMLKVAAMIWRCFSES